MSTVCQGCGGPKSTPKNRYCGECAKIVRKEMRESGYLQNTYVPPYFSEERGRTGMRDSRVLGGVPV